MRPALSESHKSALAEGREQGRAVRRHLEALEATRPRRGPRRSPEPIKHRLEAIEVELQSADPLHRLTWCRNDPTPARASRRCRRQWISSRSRRASWLPLVRTALARASATGRGVAGTLSGLLGVGGGVSTVPALVLLLGVPAAVAKGSPLAVIIPTAVVGTRRNLARDNADLRTATALGLAGTVSSLVASQISVGSTRGCRTACSPGRCSSWPRACSGTTGGPRPAGRRPTRRGRERHPPAGSHRTTGCGGTR